jgi:DNA polymerase IIIc chi subunit
MPSFLCDDPYNAELLDDDSDSESESEDTPVLITTRTSNLERLEIDALVDLANPKLIARYNESSRPVAVPQPPKPAESRTRTAEWTDENWAARDLDF